MAYAGTDKLDAENTRHPVPDRAIGCFGERLKEAMGSTSPRVFARNCGLSEGAIRSYLGGGTFPTLDRLEQIAQASGRSAVWLAFGIEPVPATKTDDIYAYIPVYDAQCPPGPGAWNERAEVLTHLAFELDLLEKRGLEPDNLSVIRVDGDSTEPVLSDGDTVLIDHSQNSLQGEGLYVILLNDDHLYAKRLQRQFDGSVEILSVNKAYKDLVVPREHVGSLEVIGRCVWAGGWLV